MPRRSSEKPSRGIKAENFFVFRFSLGDTFNCQFSILNSQLRTLIELYKLPRVAHRFEVTHKLIVRDDYRTSAIVGVEAQTFGLFEVLVEEEMHVILLVVDESEWRYRARLQTEIALHTLRRCEAQLTLVQTVLQVVNSHILVAIEAYQVVAVALVVAEKEVFAGHLAVIVPILLGNLDCRRCRVKIDLVFYVVRI